MGFSEKYCNASTGSNMNGGTDESATAAYTATNGGWNSGTGVFTPTSGDPSAVSPTLVGQDANVFLDGATTPVFIGRVTAVSSTTLTVSTTAKSGTAPTTGGTGISINVGGVWKGPNAAVAFPFGFITAAQTNASGDTFRVNFKNNATYAPTAAITHSLAGLGVFEGYSSTVGDGGYAVFSVAVGATYAVMTLSGSNLLMRSFKIDVTAFTSGFSAVITVSASTVENCVVTGHRGGAFVSSSAQSRFVQCEAYSSANGALLFDLNNGGGCNRCFAHDNSNNAVRLNSASYWINGVIDTITGIGITGGGHISNSVIYNCTSHGISEASAIDVVVENCLFVSNGAYGISNTGSAYIRSINNAFYSNTSGQTTGFVDASGTITLSGDPFVAPTTGDFDLNNTASAGAACRGAGIGTFTQTAASYTGTLSYPDIGASQHQDAGGGGLAYPVGRAI